MEVSIIWLLFVFLIARAIFKAIEKAQKEKEAENLKHNNPQLYAHLKQIEHEQQMMEHDRKRMRHDEAKTGIGIGAEIFRRFWG